MKQYKDSQQEFRELAEWVIDQAKKGGVKECKVSISRRRFVSINYRDRKPETIKEATTQGLYLEVYKDNRFAGQSTPDFRKSTLAPFITGLIDTSAIMEEDPFRTLPDPKYYAGQTSEDLELFDKGKDALTPEMRHAMAKAAENACLEKGGDAVISVEAGEYDESNEEFVLSSNGFMGSTKGTYVNVGASMTAKDEGDRRPAGYHYVGCRYRDDLPSPEEIGKEAAKRTFDLMGGKKIPTETLPVILENRGVMRIMGGLLDPMFASSIQQKRSFLIDKKGTQIGSNLLSLRDDPFIHRGLGSMYYDGDGFPARKRDLFKEGILSDYLVDWYYGRKLGWEPNSGSISNLIIDPGKRSLDEIIRDLGRCLLITDYIGGNSNGTTGDFSVGIIGRLYDKGQFVQNVAEMNIADNHLKFWNKLIEVANDPWIYDQARMPSLVFKDVVISGI
jgi:PmbA protein